MVPAIAQPSYFKSSEFTWQLVAVAQSEIKPVKSKDASPKLIENYVGISPVGIGHYIVFQEARSF